jgi:hypothetical protein
MSPDTPASDSLHEGLPVSESPTRVVASFWRRIFAFLVDVVITAVPCALVGFTFHRFFAESKLAGGPPWIFYHSAILRHPGQLPRWRPNLGSTIRAYPSSRP